MAMENKLKNVVMRYNKETGEYTPPKKAKKSYLILVTFNKTEDGERDWQWIEGREEALEHLIEQMETYDLLATQVMSETQSPDRAVTAYSFIRFCIESEKVPVALLEKHDMDLDLFMEFMENSYSEKDKDELESLYKEDMEQ